MVFVTYIAIEIIVIMSSIIEKFYYQTALIGTHILTIPSRNQFLYKPYGQRERVGPPLVCIYVCMYVCMYACMYILFVFPHPYE